MTTKTSRARLDADKTAKPKTRLVRKSPIGACVGSHLGAEYIEDENGKRTPLHGPKLTRRDVLLHVVDVPANGEGRIFRGDAWAIPVSLVRITKDERAAEIEIAGRHFYVSPESLTDLAGNPLEEGQS